MSNSQQENDQEIEIFQEYLRIPSVHPNIDYEPCILFLKRQAESLGLTYEIITVKDPKKPLMLMTWEGTDPDLPTILLNSHMDVVPVFEEYWTYPPFGAEIHDGKIYARGTQDMKCVGTQYLGAIRALKKTGFKPKRTIHLSYVPEEEVGGYDGMRDFIHTNKFKNLNIGFALDEGGANQGESYKTYFAERCSWKVNFKINGKPGHGCTLSKGTVGEKATYLMVKLNEFRESQIRKLEEEGHSHPHGNVTSVNLTVLQGGIQSNVIPPQISLTYDMRVAYNMDHAEWVAQLEKWCEESGGDIEIIFQSKNPLVPPTILDDSNKYWVAFKAATDAMGIETVPAIHAGATDIRFIRSIGIPAIGFSPINNTPFLLHDNDEFLGVETYLKGIEIFKNVIKNLSELS